VSSYEAIAAVTATVRSVLLGPVDAAIAGATITVVRPDVTSGSQLPSTGVNVFLFQVTPNAALRNADLPTRRADGTIVKRPTAAVDLHYLISFYGDDTQFQTQLLLGAVVTALHASPTLTRDQITAAIADGTVAPYLGGSDLANAVDLVRFTPTGLSLEELSKLWSVMLQIPYVLSVVYQAGPVLLEAESDVAAAALPVQRLPVVRALATGSPVQPAIQQVLAQATSSSAPAVAPVLQGYTLVLDGSYVAGVATRVQIDGNVALSTTATGAPISVVLAPSLGLLSGAHTVQVVQDLPLTVPRVALSSVPSNMAGFVLQPTLEAATAQTVTTGTGATATTTTTVSVTLTPPVGQLQRVRLLLDQVSPPAGQTAGGYSFDAPLDAPLPAAGAPFPIPISGVPSGTYLVRVQVDGAESLLTYSTTAGYTGPTVTL
jgi:Pvc16 N-terminal domain